MYPTHVPRFFLQNFTRRFFRRFVSVALISKASIEKVNLPGAFMRLLHRSVLKLVSVVTGTPVGTLPKICKEYCILNPAIAPLGIQRGGNRTGGSVDQRQVI